MSTSKETKTPAEMQSEETAAMMQSGDWAQLPWRKLERHVYRLQKRIFRASQRGNVQAVHRLQQLLMRSRSARLLAVRRVTQDNQGKRTAGIDGKASLNPKERLELANQIHPKHTRHAKAKPVRRVWIPKPGKTEKRPLGIPVMRDRATQALVKQALEPEWEARFEANSYGFRPGRGCHDAIGAIFNEARYTAKYVLDADIKGCFDHISHPALLNKLATYPAMRRIIRSWLKAGIMENQSFSPTLEGTPQGGVISPLLANIALHGIEQAVQKGTSRRSRPALVRYADDFVILHERLAVVEKARETVEEWLKGIGLELKPEKTRIVHTQHPTQGQVGFDFLGMTVRQFPMGKTHTGTIWGKPIGFKLLIKPSNAARKQHLRELSQIVKKHQTAPQWELIEALTPSIRGWANYHRTVVASQIFAETDTALHSMLRRWAKRRHPNKSQGWVSHKYWALDQGEGWKFKAPEGNTLIRHDGIHIKRHAKVRDTASPYDGDLVYWSQRLHEHPLLDSKVAKLLKLQHGKCAYCGLSFRSEDQMEKDHIIPRSLGGNDRMMNLQLLHRHCHDQKTAKDGSNKARKGQRYP